MRVMTGKRIADRDRWLAACDMEIAKANRERYASKVRVGGKAYMQALTMPIPAVTREAECWDRHNRIVRARMGQFCIDCNKGYLTADHRCPTCGVDWRGPVERGFDSIEGFEDALYDDRIGVPGYAALDQGLTEGEAA